MKRQKESWLIVCLIGIFAFSVTAFAGDARLVGKWIASLGAMDIALQLAADGTGVMAGEPLRWQTKGQRLTFEVDGDAKTYDYSVSEGSFTFVDEEQDRTLVFRRDTPTPPEKGDPAKPDAKKPDADPPIAAKHAPVDPRVGRWRADDGSEFDIGAKGTCRIGTRTVGCKLSADTLHLEGVGSKAAACACKVVANQLHLTLNGKLTVWQRGDTPSALPAERTATK
ncbi:MAG: hypothetical protein EXR77_15350 [Myxococcales bacterium]|nr:hypothetical protein [Myxococcales bacterium]